MNDFFLAFSKVVAALELKMYTFIFFEVQTTWSPYVYARR